MKYFLALCLTFFTSVAFASGGGGGGGGGSYSGGAPKRVVDQNYETGKNIFRGRNDLYADLKICVNDSATSEVVKISRRSLKPYKGSTVSDFAANLVDCNAEERVQITDKVAIEDMNLVLYYLNKRYRLKLEN